MFETLSYFLELTVSIYFFCLVMLFLINVCEFMPLNSHEAIEEEKILIRTPSKAKKPVYTTELTATTRISDGVVRTENDRDKRSKAARERWKSLPRKLPKADTWGKVLSDPKLKDQWGEVATPGEEATEESAQPAAPKEQSHDARAGNQGLQEEPADYGPTAAPADDGPSTAPVDDDPIAAPADGGPTTAPVDDVATPAAAHGTDDVAQAVRADDGLAAPENTD